MSSEVLKHFMILTPDHAYASDWYARNEREARRSFCEHFGMVRLPNGTQVWEKKWEKKGD